MNAEEKDLTKAAREIPKKTEQRTEEKTAPVAARVLRTEREAVAYMGPTLKRVIQSGAVFKNGYPVKVQECLNRYPFLAGLFVPVSGLAEARKEVRTTGTSFNVLYGEAEKIGGRTNV